MQCKLSLKPKVLVLSQFKCTKYKKIWLILIFPNFYNQDSNLIYMNKNTDIIFTFDTKLFGTRENLHKL